MTEDTTSGGAHPPVPDFNTSLGIEIMREDGDEVRAGITVTPAHHQPFGIVHGGVYCAIVETVASIGGAHWFRDGTVVGVSNHTNFIRAVRTGRLAIVAHPVHRGRTQQIWAVEITDEGARLIANGEVRLMNIASADALAKS